MQLRKLWPGQTHITIWMKVLVFFSPWTSPNPDFPPWRCFARPLLHPPLGAAGSWVFQPSVFQSNNYPLCYTDGLRSGDCFRTHLRRGATSRWFRNICLNVSREYRPVHLRTHLNSPGFHLSTVSRAWKALSDIFW